jgi:hypothetical protein
VEIRRGAGCSSTIRPLIGKFILDIFTLSRWLCRANNGIRSVERFQGQNHIHFGRGENYVTLPIIP